VNSYWRNIAESLEEQLNTYRFRLMNPTCWTCIDGHQFEDISVGIPLHVECNGKVSDKCYEIMEKLEWDEDKCAKICDGYKPRMISKCHECKKEMNVPEFAWGLWASTWDLEPVCSLECKGKLEKRFEKEIEVSNDY
jgi:hypothetical protein